VDGKAKGALKKEEKEIRVTRARSKSTALEESEKCKPSVPKPQSQGDSSHSNATEKKVTVKVVESKLPNPMFPKKLDKEDIKAFKTRKSRGRAESTTTRSRLSGAKEKVKLSLGKRLANFETDEEDEDNDLYQTAIGSPDKSRYHNSSVSGSYGCTCISI